MIKYFVEKYKSIKSEYMNRTPKGKWTFVLNMTIFIQKIVGSHVADLDFELRWSSYLLLMLLIDCYSSFIYTLWYYADQPLKGMLFIAMSGIFIPSMMVYAMVFSPTHVKEIQSFVHFAGQKVYASYSHMSNQKYARISEQGALNLLSNAIRIIMIMLVSSAIPAMFTIFILIRDHKLDLPIPILFPYTDIESISGLIINLFNQFFIAVLGLARSIGIEISLCLIKNTLWMMTVATCYAIDELVEGMTKFPSMSTVRVQIHVDYIFRNIVLQAQDIDRFVINNETSFYWRTLVRPLTLCFGICLSVFFYLKGIWTSGLAVAILSYAQLYVVCDLGNAIETTNEMLVQKLHEMPWYLMSNKSQLSYAHILNRFQSGVALRMGPFGELNLEALSKMTRRMYSYLMMLLRMQK